MATLARLNVILGLQSSEFAKGLENAQRSMKRFGAQATSAGRTMSMAITAPLVGAGGAAVKFAADFDASLGKIEGLVGVAGDQVDGFKDKILALGGETGRAPQELADAMFDITSAGFRGESAVKALRAAAMAAASGLGETRVVADALTNAVNAYGESNLSAAQATSVLVATVREGKASAETLAPVIGQLVPISSELGVSFDQVGAGLAALTRTTGNASLASTQLRAILAGILRPSEQAKKMFDQYGTSADEVRKILREKGLLAALKHLRERFGENTDDLGKAFKSIEAVSGILSLTGQNAAATDAVFASLAKTTESDLTEAFKKTDGPARDFQKVFAIIQGAAIRLGDAILPILTPIIQNVATAVTRLSDAFGSLPEPAQRAIIIVAALAAAAGPILFLIGGIATGLAAIGSSVGLWAAGIAAVVGLVIANLDQVTAAVKRIGEVARPALEDFAAFVVAQWSKVKATAAEVWPYVRDLVSWVAKGIASVWKEYGDKAVEVVRIAWEVTKTVIATALDVILAGVKGTVQLLSGDWKGFKETIVGLSQSIEKNAGGYFALFAAKVQATFAGMVAGVLGSIQSIIEKLLAWAAVASEVAFVDPITRNAARASIGILTEAYGTVGGAIDNARERQAAYNATAEAIAASLEQGREKLVKHQSEWVTIEGKVKEAATVVRDQFGAAIDATTRTLKGGFGEARDEFLVQMNEAKVKLEGTPIHVRIVPDLDTEELQRQMREAGLSPNTGGYAG